MIIYLDSKDLIDLNRGNVGFSISDFAHWLNDAGHKIALSFETVVEISAPLRNGREIEVFAFLNRLEKLPLIFINEARINVGEIVEAVGAFEEKRQFDRFRISPFSDRFDRAVSFDGHQLVTNDLVNYGLAESIVDLLKAAPDIFDKNLQTQRTWRRLIEQDRVIARPPTLAKHFATKIERDLKLYNLKEPKGGIRDFAKWVYAAPGRCPGKRLGYEVFHRLRANRNAPPVFSDLVDLSRLSAVPYVDLFMTDSRIYEYVRQVDQALHLNLPAIFRDFRKALEHLETRSHRFNG